MGYTFIPKNATNNTGHWEDVEFITLNRELAMKNCTVPEWAEQMGPLIKRRFDLNIPWGWKCPITADLLNHFTHMLPNAYYLRIDRDKEAVVRSCRRAYGWSMDQGRKLFDRRTAMMNKFLAPPINVKAIEFSALIREPKWTIQEVCDWAGLTFKQEAVDFVDKKEVHFGQETFKSKGEENIERRENTGEKINA